MWGGLNSGLAARKVSALFPEGPSQAPGKHTEGWGDSGQHSQVVFHGGCPKGNLRLSNVPDSLISSRMHLAAAPPQLP